jgi:hypothetical protein
MTGGVALASEDVKRLDASRLLRDRGRLQNGFCVKVVCLGIGRIASATNSLAD